MSVARPRFTLRESRARHLFSPVWPLTGFPRPQSWPVASRLWSGRCPSAWWKPAEPLVSPSSSPSPPSALCESADPPRRGYFSSFLFTPAGARRLGGSQREALVSPSSSPSPPSALRKSAHPPCRGYFFFFSFHVSSDFRPISGLCASQAP